MRLSKKIQTVLLIIYFAVTPLWVSNNPIVFHEVKLLIIYLCILFISFIALFDYRHNKETYISIKKTFKIELKLVMIALVFMTISFFLNLEKLYALISSKEFGDGLWKGAGPNYLSFAFYIISFLFIASSLTLVKTINFKLVSKSIVISLFIVGCLIIYQLFFYDFLGRGQNYLFGWGNSNYTPEPYSIIGLLLLIPILFTKKVNYLHLGFGIFFFELVLLSSSRAAYFALFLSISISMIVLLVKRRITIKKVLLLYGIAMLIVFVSYTVFNRFGFDSGIKELTNLNSLSENNTHDTFSLFSRLNLWGISLEYFADNFYSVLFGIGQNVFTYNTDSMHYLVSNAHNQYIEVLVSSGIVVFFIFILLLYRQFVYAVKLLNHNISNIVLLTSLIFISVKWLFNSLNASHSPFVFLVFILISYRYYEMTNQNKNINIDEMKADYGHP